MKKEELIEAMVSDVMEDFDFDKVHDVIKYLGWKIQIRHEFKVPSSYQLMKIAENLLRTCMCHYGAKESYCSGCFGFMASLDNDELTLQFILTESSSFVADVVNNKEG